MLLQTELLEALNKHIESHPITATAFGRQVAGDPCLVFDIRRGRSPSLVLAERIMATIKAQQTEVQQAAE